MATFSSASITSPLALPGCSLWLDGADPTTVSFSNGVNVSQWNDKSSNLNYFTTTSGGPTYNSSTGLLFNGTSDIMASHLSNTYTAGVTSVFMVVNFTSGVGFSYLLIFGGNATDLSVRYGSGIFNGNDIFYSRVYNLNGINGGSSLPSSIINKRSLLDGIVNNTGTTQLQLSTSFNARYFTGYINEVILYNTLLTATQRESIEFYLSQKWNIPLSMGPVSAGISLPTLAKTYPFFSKSITTPLLIPGCALWLDAADASTITLSGSNVTQWNDKSGNGYNAATPAGTITYNATPINGKPTISFAATSYLTTTSMTYTTNYRNVYAAVQMGSQFLGNGSTNYAIVYCLSNTIGPSTYSYSGDFSLSRWGSGILNTYSPQNIWNTQTIVTTTNSPGNVGIFFNGNPQSLNTNIASSTSFTTGSTTITVGGEVTSFKPIIIGELIIFDGIQTPQQRESIEFYLSQKWNIPLSMGPVGAGVSLPSLTSLIPFSVPTPAVFSPLSISGCVLWFDASDATTVTKTSGMVSSVLDKSGNGYNLSNGTGFTYPNNTFNGGYPSFYNNSAITASSVIGVNTSFSVSQPITVFFVGQIGTYASGSYVFDATSSTNRITLYNASLYLMWAGGVGIQFASSNVPPVLLSCFYNGGSSSEYLNGINSQQGSVGNNTMSGITFGNRYSLNQAFGGHICELIYFSSILTTQQRQQVELYLAHKWNIPLNVGGVNVYF